MSFQPQNPSRICTNLPLPLLYTCVRTKVRTNRTASGWAVVKTWCVPVLKVKQRGYAPCTPKKAYTQVKLLLAQQQVCVGGSEFVYWAGGGGAGWGGWVGHLLLADHSHTPSLFC